MAVAIKVPTVGESISEGTLSRWFKKDGEAVKANEPLYELETEKATTEVVAPASGTLRISVPEGQTVPIGSPVGVIEEGASAGPPKERRDDGAAQAKEANQKAPGPPDQKGKAAAAGEPSKAAPLGEAVLSPSARRLAEEGGVNVQQLAGTGRGGRVIKEDVLGHLERGKAEETKPEPSGRKVDGAPAPVPAPRSPEAGPRETRQRMSAIRLRIAERLITAQNTAAILTTFNEADMTAVMALRARYKDSFKEKYNVNLGFMSFFVKACIEGLRAFPLVNARIDNNEIVYQNFYDIGVAVSTEKGLMVPVVRDADRLSFADIEKYIGEMAQKARQGKITVNDLQGGTFTITNGGIFGSLLSTPILNAPQSGILGMHSIQKRPVAVNDQVVVRPMMYLAHSYDHRIIDGREAVQFLVRVKECVENPERLLLEV